MVGGVRSNVSGSAVTSVDWYVDSILEPHEGTLVCEGDSASDGEGGGFREGLTASEGAG